MSAGDSAESVAMTWSVAVADFKTDLYADRSRAHRTRWDYVQHVRWLAEGASSGPWALTSTELAAWLDSKNWSQETRRKVLVSLRAFYGWAVRAGRLEWAPTAGLPARARRAPGPKSSAWPEAWAVPVEAWLTTLRAGSRAPGTIDQYVVRLRSLAFAAADPWAVTGAQLAEWLANPDWSPQTRRCRGVAAGSFYGWAVKAGHVEVSPAADLDPTRVPRALPRPAPDEALRVALAGADDRTRLAAMLQAYAGLRIAEVAGLHTSNLTATHVLVVGKGGHHRVVPIDPAGDLVAELRAEMARRRRGTHGSGWSGAFVSADGYLFPSTLHPGPMTPNALGRNVGRALPGDWTPHTLRHRFATRAYAAQRDLLAVQHLLGHARPETTSVYAQVPQGALLAAVQGAGGGLNAVTGL